MSCVWYDIVVNELQLTEYYDDNGTKRTKRIADERYVTERLFSTFNSEVLSCSYPDDNYCLRYLPPNISGVKDNTAIVQRYLTGIGSNRTGGRGWAAQAFFFPDNKRLKMHFMEDVFGFCKKR